MSNIFFLIKLSSSFSFSSDEKVLVAGALKLPKVDAAPFADDRGFRAGGAKEVPPDFAELAGRAVPFLEAAASEIAKATLFRDPVGMEEEPRAPAAPDQNSDSVIEDRVASAPLVQRVTCASNLSRRSGVYGFGANRAL